MDAYYKDGWATSLAFFANRLKRTGLSRKVQNFDISAQHYYFISRAAWISLLRAFRAHRDYEISVESGVSQTQLEAIFTDWCKKRMDSGDQVFRYYCSRYMFGLGALFEYIEHAIKEQDVKLLSALLLTVMGFYAMMGKRNLSGQCF